MVYVVRYNVSAFEYKQSKFDAFLAEGNVLEQNLEQIEMITNFYKNMHDFKVLLNEPEFQKCRIILIINETEPYCNFGGKSTTVNTRSEEDDLHHRIEMFRERINFDEFIGEGRRNDITLFPIDLSKKEEYNNLKKAMKGIIDRMSGKIGSA